MSPLFPLISAAAAAILLYGRHKRFTTRTARRHWGDPRPRALAEAVASSLTVLIVGKMLAASVPVPAHTDTVFTTLALGIAVSQFMKSLRAPRALITVRR